MVPYNGEKAGAGRLVSLVYGFDARWLLQQREGDCRDGSPQKKERKTSHEVGGTLWINLRSATCIILRHEKEFKTSSHLDNSSSSSHSHACQLGPPTIGGGRKSGWAAAAQLEVAGSRAGKTQTHLGTAARPMVLEHCSLNGSDLLSPSSPTRSLTHTYFAVLAPRTDARCLVSRMSRSSNGPWLPTQVGRYRVQCSCRDQIQTHKGVCPFSSPQHFGRCLARSTLPGFGNHHEAGSTR